MPTRRNVNDVVRTRIRLTARRRIPAEFLLRDEKRDRLRCHVIDRDLILAFISTMATLRLTRRA